WPRDYAATSWTSPVQSSRSRKAHVGMPNSSIYGASKGALLSLARTLSGELISPGKRLRSSRSQEGSPLCQDRVAVDLVTIAEEIGRRDVIRAGVHGLLSRPGGARMLGDVEVE